MTNESCYSNILKLYENQQLIAVFRDKNWQTEQHYICCYYYNSKQKILSFKLNVNNKQIAKMLIRKLGERVLKTGSNIHVDSYSVLIFSNFTSDLFTQNKIITNSWGIKPYDYPTSIVFSDWTNEVIIDFEELFMTQKSFLLIVMKNIINVNIKVKNDSPELTNKCLEFEKDILDNNDFSDEEKLYLKL